MRDVGNAAAGANLGLHLVSFSVDGEHDTPPVLRAYAEKHHLAAPLHVLLTGDSKDIAEQAERDFKIAVQGTIDLKAEHLGITHGSHLVLVDQTGRIRGYFRSSDDEAMAQLMIAIKQLSKE